MDLSECYWRRAARYWKKFTSQNRHVIERIGFALNVLARRKAGELPEFVDEMGLVVEPVLQGDLAPVGGVSPFDLPDRLLEAHDLHVLFGRRAHLRLEQADEVLLRVADLFAKPLKADTRLVHHLRQGKLHAARSSIMGE